MSTDERNPETYLLSPHLLKQAQWKVCEHGTVTRPVTAESIRSRQTGQVGSSYTASGPRSTPSRSSNSETESGVSMLTERTRTT